MGSGVNVQYADTYKTKIRKPYFVTMFELCELKSPPLAPSVVPTTIHHTTPLKTARCFTGSITRTSQRESNKRKFSNQVPKCPIEECRFCTSHIVRPNEDSIYRRNMDEISEIVRVERVIDGRRQLRNQSGVFDVGLSPFC